MKKYFYILLFAGTFIFSSNINAQCSVAINSLIVTGMTVSASASGVGNQFPYYLWYWDDQTTSGSTHSYNQHTYTQTGGYQVCVTYSDSANPFACISSDCDSLLIGNMNGTEEIEPLKASIKISPNPVINTATISVMLNKQADVVITLFDLTGKEVEKIEDGKLESGLHFISWNPETLPDGVYFIQIKAGDSVQTKKIIRTSAN